MEIMHEVELGRHLNNAVADVAATTRSVLTKSRRREEL